MILLSLIAFFSFSFTEIIDHQIPSNVIYQSPLDIKIYTDYNSKDIAQLNLYYRSGSSGPYMMGKFTSLSNDYYSYTIPAEFLNTKYIEYYILLEKTSGEYLSIPSNDPHDVPLSVRVSEPNDFDSIDFEQTGLSTDVNIISPQPNQNLLAEDLFIALSYFRMSEIDEQKIQIFVDDINMTNTADIRQSSLTLTPSTITSGYHTIKVIVVDLDGKQYNPVKWDFYIMGESEKIKNSAFSGKLWSDYLDNKVDTVNAYTNNTNLNLKFESDWIDIKAKLKKSSLENKYYQARDRYSFNIDMNNLKIQYGDFYPNINNFIISGNRVRGVGFKYSAKFLQLDLVTGELARSVQGNPLNDAVVISDYSSEYICPDPSDATCSGGYDNRNIDISRSNYTFKRDVSALRIGYGNKDRMNFGFNILKVKDDVNSVNKEVPNAIVSLPNDIELFQNFNSDQFIDIDNSGEWTEGVDELYLDINNNGTYDDDFTSWQLISNTGYDVSIPDSIERVKVENSILYCEIDPNDSSQCLNEEIKPLIQYIWEIKVENKNLNDFLINNYSENLDQVTYLDDQWSGDNPKDNLTFGSDFSFKSKNKNLRFRSSVAMSFLNENIWNPVKSVNDFDTYSDEYTDCEFGTTYSNLELLTENCTEVFEIGGCNLGDHYWFNCEAFTYVNGISDTKIDLEVLQAGIPLDAIPDPEDFSDIFHYNFDAVPAIPFYSVIQKLQATGSCNVGTCEDTPGVYVEDDDSCDWTPIEDENLCTAVNGIWLENSYSFKFSDLFNSPEIAYDMDFSLKVLNNQIKFGIKQVGQSFNTLGNPYLQKDMREKYISDRLRILENRMFLAFKYSIITNGISELSAVDKSNKFDVNISYYPSISLPSFNVSLANYTRNSGEETEGYSLTSWDSGNNVCDGDDTINNESDCNNNLTGAFDTRVNTETNNYNLSVNHTFDYMYKHNATFTYYYSSKKDLLLFERGFIEEEDELVQDTSYVSPRSRSRNLGINVKTTFSEKWEGNFNYSNSAFDYAQVESPYYEQQQINTLTGSFSYKMNHKIEKIGGGIDYVNGSGSSSYNQFSIRMYSEFLLLNNLNLNIRYNYRIKKIKFSDDYYNSLFKVNLSYRF